MTSKIARPGLKRINGDASLEYGGIPIAGENTGDEYTSDSDDSADDLALKDMTPEQVIRALRQGRHVREPQERLKPAATISEMEMVIRERRRGCCSKSVWVRSVLQCVTPGWTDKHVIVLHPRGAWLRYDESG